MFYWSLLLLLGLMTFLNYYAISFHNYPNGLLKSKVISGRKIYIILATGGLIVFLGLRSLSVGADTEMYSILFQKAKDASSLNALRNSWHHIDIEIGFVTFEYVISKYFNYNFFLTVIAIITLVPAMRAIYKYSRNYWMSIFIMIAFGYYSFFMSGIRQGIAMGICFIAYDYAKQYKIVKFLICIIIAILFHQSAIVFLPVYWLVKIKPTKTIFFIYIIALSISILFGRSIFLFLNHFSRQTYSITSDAGGYRLFILMMLIFILGIFFRRSFIDDYNTRIPFYMAGVSTIIWPIVSANAGTFRLFYYYDIFSIIYVANLLSFIKPKNTQVFLTIIYLLVGCYYLYVYIINSALMYSPYYFFWNTVN